MVTQKLCPECGADLTDRDPYAHMLDHYPEHIEPYPTNKQAIERQALLLKMASEKGGR